MNPPQDNLKRRLMSRMKNYTNNQRILKRYKNDLNLLGNVTKSETLKKVFEDELIFLEDWYGICKYKSTFKDDVIEDRINWLKQKLKELEMKWFVIIVIKKWTTIQKVLNVVLIRNVLI